MLDSGEVGWLTWELVRHAVYVHTVYSPWLAGDWAGGGGAHMAVVGLRTLSAASLCKVGVSERCT